MAGFLATGPECRLTMSTGSPVHLAGYACRFPDAADPAELFANIMDRRQSFRVVPDERLPLSDYLAAAIGDADSITPILAGLLTDWQFDPQRFRIPKDAFASTDLVHWLALEVAAAAVAQCGGSEALPRDATGVIVANTLTGEFSRTSQLRLRWPWLDRQLAVALDAEELDATVKRRIREAYRAKINAALLAPDEETLAGGLANTIAGRIANHFDLHGGAWLVDAACASSLVAIANAAEQITCGRVEAMIVVGVDLSLDPFELVGFSRNGALSGQRMRVFDRRADGFWPGEGAGAVVLVSDAWTKKHGGPRGIELAGWGLSSDGRGGLTRPVVSGQLRALREAYSRFGLDPGRLAFLEAHGTGTAIGDPTEIEALATILGGEADGRRVPVGSIKANIGHTKAAAGLAGLIKAAEALRNGLIPPHTGCSEPHPIFATTSHRLEVAGQAAALPSGPGRVLAGVPSFGFGGINAHAVLRTCSAPAMAVPALPCWSEDELFAFAADDLDGLAAALTRLEERAASASVSEVRDLAASLAREEKSGQFRLAFVAGRPDELLNKIGSARRDLLGSRQTSQMFGQATAAPRIGLLFPGQGAPCRSGAGAWGDRFGLTPIEFELAGEPEHTRNAQPLVIGAAMAGLELLGRLGIEANVALGHSLGELAALHWAGSFGRDEIMAITHARGRAMGDLDTGAMLLLACDSEQALQLIAHTAAEIACYNAPREIIVAGPEHDVVEVWRRADRQAVAAQLLRVSHAFHSRMMAPAEAKLRDTVRICGPSRLDGMVVSTVTGELLEPESDLEQLLVKQLTEPVRFVTAAAQFSKECDFAIEVGPGTSMTRLIEPYRLPAASLDIFGQSCRPVFECLARLHTAGCQLNFAAIYPDAEFRSPRAVPPRLLSNPCGGSNAVIDAIAPIAMQEQARIPEPIVEADIVGEHCLDQLTALVAQKTGLAPQSIGPDLQFLDDLHLNSLAVSRILARLAQHRGILLPGHRTAFSNASLREVADELDEIEARGPVASVERVVGISHWVRRFRPVWHDPKVGPLDLFDWREVSLGDLVPADAPAVAIRIDSWDAMQDGPHLLTMVRQASVASRHLALLHQGAPLDGFVRSLAMEGHFELVRSVDVTAWPGPLPSLPSGETVLSIDCQGAIQTAALALDTASHSTGEGAGIRPTVIVVTGGARGIGAEVAMELANRSGAALILVGRSDESSADVTGTLERARALGLQVGYARSGVEDGETLSEVIGEWIGQFGPPSHLVHAAGINEPSSFADLDEHRLLRTLAPKCLGLRNAIEACGPSLRRVVGFGSIIGRLGLVGEAHYALANAEQGRLLAKATADKPTLSSLHIEWSVWSGAGMGDRLGVIDQLRADGVDAIPLDEAIRQSCDLILSEMTGPIVVTSRFACSDPLPAAGTLRFLDQILIHTPDVELVVETTLNYGRDPYLLSHKVDDVPVVPGVVLLESMAQVAAPLLAPDGIITRFDRVEFLSAVSVGIEGRRIRVAALRETDDTVSCEVRSDEDQFGEPVLRAILRRNMDWQKEQRQTEISGPELDGLYGPLFFQGPAFQLLDRLGELSSRRIEARLKREKPDRLFGAFESQQTVLGNPHRRDCGLHVLQACVPHRRVLPVRVKRVELGSDRLAEGIRAHECWAKGDEYAFDIAFFDAEGVVVERWHEAVFRAVGAIAIEPALTIMPKLAGPYWNAWHAS